LKQYKPNWHEVLLLPYRARHQLGQTFQANQLLEQSLDIAQKLPSEIDWSILVSLQVLQREALGLIQDGPIGGEKQTNEARR
jgi:hypothetical protein